jgi:hypothetical protein
LAENETEQEIMDEIDNNICAVLGGYLEQACDQLVAQIPNIVCNSAFIFASDDR